MPILFALFEGKYCKDPLFLPGLSVVPLSFSTLKLSSLFCRTMFVASPAIKFWSHLCIPASKGENCGELLCLLDTLLISALLLCCVKGIWSWRCWMGFAVWNVAECLTINGAYFLLLTVSSFGQLPRLHISNPGFAEVYWEPLRRHCIWGVTDLEQAMSAEVQATSYLVLRAWETRMYIICNI